MVKCSVCGGTFEALSRAHGQRRAFVYGCSMHRRKGGCICGNALVVPMEAADDAILSAIEDVILNPAVVSQALDYAIEALTVGPGEHQGEREKDLAIAERAVSRLTAAIATAGDLQPLVEELRVQEARRREIQASLAAMQTPRHLPNTAELRRQLRRHLSDWRRLLRENATQGRQLIGRLIVGKITFEPCGDAYLFRATGTVQPMVAGLVHCVASLMGASWNSLLDWFRQLNKLRAAFRGLLVTTPRRAR